MQGHLAGEEANGKGKIIPGHLALFSALPSISWHAMTRWSLEQRAPGQYCEESAATCDEKPGDERMRHPPFT